jgi:hypothetical protein
MPLGSSTSAAYVAVFTTVKKSTERKAKERKKDKNKFSLLIIFSP